MRFGRRIERDRRSRRSTRRRTRRGPASTTESRPAVADRWPPKFAGRPAPPRPRHRRRSSACRAASSPRFAACGTRAPDRSPARRFGSRSCRRRSVIIRGACQPPCGSRISSTPRPCCTPKTNAPRIMLGTMAMPCASASRFCGMPLCMVIACAQNARRVQDDLFRRIGLHNVLAHPRLGPPSATIASTTAPHDRKRVFMDNDSRP